MMNPDDGPALRHMPLPNIISLYFPRENLLIIDRELYDRLSDDQRQQVLRTEKKTLKIYYPPNKPPVITSNQSRPVMRRPQRPAALHRPGAPA
jgi:hypothetical protein